MLFRLNGIIYGRNLRVFNKFYLEVHKGATIKIGNNLIFSSGNAYNPLCRDLRGMIFLDYNASLVIGNNSGFSSTCIWAQNSITIGNNVKVGGDCIILDTDCHNLDWRIRNSNRIDTDGRSIDGKTANSAPIIIEDDVLIGSRCIILKGVTIGARSIIGSGSIVTKSIPKDCIAAGNPCKVIKYLS